jgi:hypothetical protein
VLSSSAGVALKIVSSLPLTFRLRTRRLGALVRKFNSALAASKPFIRAWSDAQHAVDAVLTERRRRIERPWPHRFGP